MKYLILIAMALTTATLVAQDTIRTKKKNNRKIRTYEKTMIIGGNPQDVFAFMDNIENTGMHQSLGFLLGKWYSKWCVKSMLKDTEKHFRNSSTNEK